MDTMDNGMTMDAIIDTDTEMDKGIQTFWCQISEKV